MLLALFGDVGVVYATVVMTVLIVVFGEILPKTVGAHRAGPRRAPGRAADLLAGADLRAAGQRVEMDRARHAAPVRHQASMETDVLAAHEEIRGAVDSSIRRPVEKRDRDMLGGVLDLRELAVADIMVHRTR